MAKKKEKKADKQSKGKSGLSNLEREKYLQSISELEHKIEWRQHLFEIIHTSKRNLEDTYEAHKEDTAQALTLLEQSIRDHQQATQTFQDVSKEAERRLREIQEANALRLCGKLKKIEANTILEREVLDKLRWEIEDAETYDARHRLGEEFYLARELNKKVPLEELQKMSEQSRRRGTAYAKVAKEFVRKETDRHFAELDAAVPEEEKQILEDNQRLREQIDFLDHFLNHNAAIKDKICSASSDLEMSLKSARKEYRKAFDALNRNEVAIFKIQANEREMARKQKSKIKNSCGTSEQDKAREDSAFKSFKKEGDLVIRSLHQVKVEEEEIRRLEEVLAREKEFGEDLKGFVDRAREIVDKEAKTPLVVTYNGPPDKRKTAEELQKLFEEATKFIYQRGGRTMV